jgi:hypothetical protein
MDSIFQSLQKGRREVGLFQHHDAITGTSLNRVMADYGARLHVAALAVGQVQARAMSKLLTRLVADKS